MAGSSVEETYPASQTKDTNVNSDEPDEHLDHTYSVGGAIMDADVPHSDQSPETIVLRRKIRRLHRRAQRQKHKIKCLKQLLKKLKAST